ELPSDPGDRLEPRAVARGDRRRERPRRHAGEDDQRGPRPEPLHLAEELEERALARCEEPEELDRVLANLGVDEEPHGAPHRREIGERLERDVHGVADAPHVDHEPVGSLLGYRAGERCDHAAPPRRRSAGSRSTAAVRSLTAACWRWQSASASASAASGAGGRGSPSRSAMPRPIARLSACPQPTAGSFPLAGAYSWSAVPVAPAAASTAPRASPSRTPLCTFPP